MKKIIVLGIVLVLAATAYFMIGCTTASSSDTTTTTTTTSTTTSSGATTTTTTSTTTTTGAQTRAYETARTASLIVCGNHQMGQTMGQLSGASGRGEFDAFAVMSGPPAPWFSTDVSATTDGWVAFSTTEVFGGNMDMSMRLYTIGGDLITGSLLNNKLTAVLGTYEALHLFLQGVDVSSGIQSFATLYHTATNQAENPYVDTDIFTEADTLGEYIAWSYMLPSMESGYQQQIPGLPSLTSPEATHDDWAGTMECRGAFSTVADGTMIVEVTCDPSEGGGKPLVGSYTGSANLTLLLLEGQPSLYADGTMTFSQDGDNFSFDGITMVATNDAGDALTFSMDPTTEVGEGTITAEGSTGTVTFTESGGTLTWEAGPLTGTTTTWAW